MDNDLEKQLQARIAQLEKENQYLRDFNTLLQQQRKEYLDELCGPVREQDIPTEAQMIEMMKEPRRSMEELFKELGIPYGKTA